MDAKLFLKNNLSCLVHSLNPTNTQREMYVACLLGNYSNSSKNNPGKAIFTLPKNECARKAWIAALNRKEGISVQSQHANVKSTIRRALF